MGAGVTNLLTSAFKEIGSEVMDYVHRTLNDKVSGAGLKLIMYGDAVRDLIANQIELFRPSATIHRQDTIDAASLGAETIYALQWIDTEALAAKANLKAILHECLNGHVATAELAEMLGYDELNNIRPKDTKLYYIANRGRRFFHN